MKALIDRIKKSNEFLNLFTLHNVFDADATDNIRRCILKNELAVDSCEKLVNEVSTIDEALPISDVVGQSEQLVCDHQWKSRFSEKRGSWRLCTKCSKEG
jgi:hypothetical protein